MTVPQGIHRVVKGAAPVTIYVISKPIFGFVMENVWVKITLATANVMMKLNGLAKTRFASIGRSHAMKHVIMILMKETYTILIGSKTMIRWGSN